MDPRDRKIEELLKLTEENNEMLHTMRRSMRIATIARIVYWVILVGIAVGAYYMIQPYIEEAQQVYTNIDQKFTSIDEEFQGNLQSFFDFFRNTETQAE